METQTYTHTHHQYLFRQFVKVRVRSENVVNVLQMSVSSDSTTVDFVVFTSGILEGIRGVDLPIQVFVNHSVYFLKTSRYACDRTLLITAILIMCFRSDHEFNMNNSYTIFPLRMCPPLPIIHSAIRLYARSHRAVFVYGSRFYRL